MVPVTPRDRRHRLIELARRRARPGTGSAVESLARRHWNSLPVDLSSLRTPYVVVGAVATRLYMPFRHSLDIAIMTTSRHVASLETELEALGWTRTGTLSIGGSSWIDPAGEQLDLLVVDEPWAREAITSARTSPDGLPVVDLPFLVLMKLAAARSRDIGDLSQLLGHATPEQRDIVRSVVARYQPEDLEDLESLIHLGDLELR